MKKFGKRLLIVIGFLGVLYVAYMVFMMPSGFVNKTDVVNSYISNLSSADVCEQHFNEETQDHCASMTGQLKDHVVVVTSIAASGDNLILTITVDGTVMVFEVSFVVVEVTGLKSFFNKTYYYIDFMI